MIGLIISRQRTPHRLALRASFLINSNEELGTACFSSRRCVPRLTPADGRVRRFSGARPSYRLLFPQESFSQSHAHSLALCCSCFPGGPACSSTRQARAPVSLGFSFIFIFSFIFLFFGPRRFRAVGRRWWVEKFFGRRQGSSGSVLRSGQCAEAGEGVCGLVTSSDIGTFSRSRREEKVK